MGASCINVGSQDTQIRLPLILIGLNYIFTYKMNTRIAKGRQSAPTGVIARAPHVRSLRPHVSWMSNRTVAAQSSSPTENENQVQEVSMSDANTCPTCGIAKDKMAFGCDGSGRIMGGLAAIPGFGWWPIKAYRPCGKAVEAGVEYKRKGQGVDEVMFGRK